MAYSSQTVAVLKEELKNRSLSTAGVKADLVARLEEDDASKQQTEASIVPAQEETAVPVTEEAQPEQQPSEPAVTESGEQSEENKAKIAKLIEDWEAKINDLETQIKRVEKFGGDESKTEKLKEGITKLQEKIEDIKVNGLRKKPTPVSKLSHEELKKLAVEHLTKKLERATKFGGEDEKQAIEKELQRVERFGVEAGAALASEIGLTRDRELGSGRHHQKRSPKGFRSRVHKK